MMSNFAAGNFISKLSINLQPHLVSLPWLKRSVVRCFSHNTDSSELPIRYIPKRCRDVKQTQDSTSENHASKDGIPTRPNSGVHGPKTSDGTKHPLGSSTYHKMSNISLDDEHELNQKNGYDKEATETECIKAPQEAVEYMKVPKEVVPELKIFKGVGPGQRYKLNRESNYHDGVMDGKYMEVCEEVVEEAQTYNLGGKGKQDSSKACRTKQGAEQLAIELLAKRAFTAVELRKKLNRKHFPQNIVDAVMHDLQDRGLINDRLYAEMFSQSRWTSSSWGPRRIKHALLNKGVSKVDVEKAVKLVFEEAEDGDQRSSMRLSNSSLQQLYVQATKQWQRSHNVPHETRKARVIRWLQYRGFDWGVVGIILKKLESEYPP